LYPLIEEIVILGVFIKVVLSVLMESVLTTAILFCGNCELFIEEILSKLIVLTNTVDIKLVANNVLTRSVLIEFTSGNPEYRFPLIEDIVKAVVLKFLLVI